MEQQPRELVCRFQVHQHSKDHLREREIARKGGGLIGKQSPGLALYSEHDPVGSPEEKRPLHHLDKPWQQTQTWECFHPRIDIENSAKDTRAIEVLAEGVIERGITFGLIVIGYSFEADKKPNKKCCAEEHHLHDHSLLPVLVSGLRVQTKAASTAWVDRDRD